MFSPAAGCVSPTPTPTPAFDPRPSSPLLHLLCAPGDELQPLCPIGRGVGVAGDWSEGESEEGAYLSTFLLVESGTTRLAVPLRGSHSSCLAAFSTPLSLLRFCSRSQPLRPPGLRTGAAHPILPNIEGTAPLLAVSLQARNPAPSL